MRKTLAIIFTFLIVATLTIGLVACGGTNSNGSSKSSNDSNSSSSSLSPREKFESEMSNPVICNGVSYTYDKSSDKVIVSSIEIINDLQIFVVGAFKPGYIISGTVEIDYNDYVWEYRLYVSIYNGEYTADIDLKSGDWEMERIIVTDSVKTTICEKLAKSFKDYHNYCLAHTGYDI